MISSIHHTLRKHPTWQHLFDMQRIERQDAYFNAQARAYRQWQIEKARLLQPARPHSHLVLPCHNRAHNLRKGKVDCYA